MIDLIKAKHEKPLRDEVLMRQDRLGFGLSLQGQKELFYHDCTDTVRDYAIRNLQEQTVAPKQHVFLSEKLTKMSLNHISGPSMTVSSHLSISLTWCRIGQIGLYIR